MNPLYTGDIQAVTRVSFLWLLPLFPLLGATVNALFGKRLQDRYGKGAVHAVAVGAMVCAALVAITGFIKLVTLPAEGRFLLDTVWPMLRIGALELDFAFAMDPLSGLMALIITIIGTLIHVYATGYMATEKAYWRFFCYLNLFVFSMLMLVMGDSFLLMFFGWEGVGLCSYLLIGFWYTDVEKAKAGMKAFVVNRVGDWGFITGLLVLFWGLGGAWGISSFKAEPGQTISVASPGCGGAMELSGTATKGIRDRKVTTCDVSTGPTVVFRELRNQLSVKDIHDGKPFEESLKEKTIFGLPLLFIVCLCFFVGATGKSAQIPLYVWLPDAMAGPTPVSALIHAATMVTAGVYMIARVNFLFVLTPGAMTVVAVVGVLTALLGASIGLFQYDIKKVLAYSTISQLGFMFVGVGVGAYWAGVFHLLTHACFKACLFLGSGSVIHGMHFLEHGHDDHGGGGHGADPHAPAHGAIAAHGQAPVAAHTAHAEHAEPEAPKREIDLRLSPNPTDPQDMRNMGGLARLMPKTRWTYFMACFAIAGFPWAAGFYSKDEILWKAFSNGNTLVPGQLIWLVGFITAGCTAFYMFRSYYMTFYARPPTKEIQDHVHESPASITVVLQVLAVLSLGIGVLLGIPAAIGHAFHIDALSVPVLEHWLEPVFAASAEALKWKDMGLAPEFLLMIASITIASAGWGLARFLYKDMARTKEMLERWKLAWAGVHRTVFNKYYVDEFYREAAIIPALEFSKMFAWFDGKIVDGLVNGAGRVGKWCSDLGGWIDRTFVDGAVNGVADLVFAGGRQAMKLQTGRINNYVFGITVGVVVLVCVSFLFGS